MWWRSWTPPARRQPTTWDILPARESDSHCWPAIPTGSRHLRLRAARTAPRLGQSSIATGRDLDPQSSAALLANDAAALGAYFRRSEDEPGIPESVLRTMDTPTLLLAGTEDPLRHADSERAAQLMPRAQFQALPGRNHGQTLVPAGPVLSMVTSFITSAATAANNG